MKTDLLSLVAKAMRKIPEKRNAFLATCLTAREFLRSGTKDALAFYSLCERAGTKPTARQVRKFRSKRGLAWLEHRGIREEWLQAKKHSHLR